MRGEGKRPEPNRALIAIGLFFLALVALLTPLAIFGRVLAEKHPPLWESFALLGGVLIFAALLIVMAHVHPGAAELHSDAPLTKKESR